MLRHIERWFTEEWEIWKLEEVLDDWDNPIEDWTFSEKVKGRSRPLSGDRRVSSGKETEFVDTKFYCKFGADIEVGDRLRNPLNNRFYRVVFPQDPMSMGRFLQVELKYIEEQ